MVTIKEANWVAIDVSAWSVSARQYTVNVVNKSFRFRQTGLAGFYLYVLCQTKLGNRLLLLFIQVKFI